MEYLCELFVCCMCMGRDIDDLVVCMAYFYILQSPPPVAILAVLHVAGKFEKLKHGQILQFCSVCMYA